MKRDWIFWCASLLFVLGLSAIGIQKVMPVSTSYVTQSEMTLILDAGHGGEDGGAVTSGGTKESDINLAIVRKLDALLAFCGTEARLTRSEDVSLHSEGCQTTRERKVSDLKNRVEFVRSAANPLLISVHQNYFTDPRYSGAQVFYNTGDISRQWGESTQEVLRQVLDSDNDRKAKLLSEGTVYLFEHISCPSILVECGFLSNGEEASLLLTDSYQRKIALALTSTCLRQIQILQSFSGGE